ncbi:MAG TPA: sulfite exporter TauE/SafE family protein [Chitinophagaceae bacterium]|nr:sulfite exporter TauE/SafE family protein [Chitinophagaceae bacterium]
MSTGAIIGIIILGLVAGALSSLVGIGGGIVIVPALVMGFAMNQKEAAATTLAMLSFPVTFVAAYTYHKNGMVDWKVAGLLCLGFVLGGYLGSKVAIGLPTLLIKRIFAVIMIVIAIKFLFFDKK